MEHNLHRILIELKRQFEGIYSNRLLSLLIFGSQARDDAAFGSDIDILVVLEGAVRPAEEILRTGGITSSLSLQYDVVISCTFISGARFAKEKSPLIMNIRREGIPV